MRIYYYLINLPVKFPINKKSKPLYQINKITTNVRIGSSQSNVLPTMQWATFNVFKFFTFN